MIIYNFKTRDLVERKRIIHTLVYYGVVRNDVEVIIYVVAYAHDVLSKNFQFYFNIIY